MLDMSALPFKPSQNEEIIIRLWFDFADYISPQKLKRKSN